MPGLQRIERPAAEEYAHYFQRYIDLVPGEDVLQALRTQRESTAALLGPLTGPQGLHRYAPGKWTVNETAVHLSDAERVFAYRALRFARNDHTELPGFDEGAWVPESRSDVRSMGEILGEWLAVRDATLALFRSLDGEACRRVGVANGQPMSARAAAWCIAGHELHHVALLRDRYGLGR
ncbi:MAG: DinB family protein [Candidatus Eisenbacteria bacterium]